VVVVTERLQAASLSAHVNFLDATADSKEKLIPAERPCSWVLQRCRDLGTKYVQEFDADGKPMSKELKISKDVLRRNLPAAHFLRPVFVKRTILVQGVTQPIEMSVAAADVTSNVKDIWLRSQDDVHFRRKVSVDALRFMEMAPTQYFEILRKCF